MRPRQARRGQQVLTDLLRTPRPHPPILSTGPITSLFIINCTTVWKNDSARNILLAILTCSLQFYGGLNNAIGFGDSPPREGVSANLLKYLSLVANCMGCILEQKKDAMSGTILCFSWLNLVQLTATHSRVQSPINPDSKTTQVTT